MILRSDISITERSDQTVPWVATDERLGTKELQFEVLNPYTYGPGRKGDDKSYYQIASGTSDEKGLSAKQARNQLQSAIIRVSDKAVAGHLAQLKVAESVSNNTLGFATLGLAAAATATTGGTATGLAAGATVASGTRSLVNEQEFRNALVESIIVLIEKDREQALERILHLQSFPIENYNVEQAITDATNYHYRGSFYHGLALLAEAARKSGNDLEQSTASFVRGKAELARLIGLEGGKQNFDKFITAPGDSSNKVDASEWLATATPEKVAVALAYMRSTTFVDEKATRKRKLQSEQELLLNQQVTQRASLTQLTISLTSYRSVRDAKTNELEAFRSALNSAEEKVRSLQADIATISMQIESNSAAMTKALDEKPPNTSTHDRLVQENEVLRTKKSTLTEQLTAAAAEADKLKNQGKETTLSEDIRLVNNSIATLEANERTLSESVAVMENRLKQISEALDKLLREEQDKIVTTTPK